MTTTERLPFGDWDEAGARARKRIEPIGGYDGPIKLLQLDYHRNGSGGAGFYTGFIETDGRTLMFTTFDHGGEETAVVDFDAITEKHADEKSLIGIQFMYNSLRGADYYGQAIRQFIADQRYLTYVDRDGQVKAFEWAIWEEGWSDDPTPDLRESRYFEPDKTEFVNEWEKAVANVKHRKEWEASREENN